MLKKIDATELFSQYITHNKTIGEVASFFNVGKTTIIRNLKNFNITKPKDLTNKNIEKSLHKNCKYDKQLILQLYLEDNKTAKEIASQLGCSNLYVRKIVSKQDLRKTPEQIKDISTTYKKSLISKEEFYDLYVLKNLTAEELAKQLSCTVSMIYTIARDFGIRKPRSNIEISSTQYTNISFLKDRDWFYNEYIILNKTIKTISKEIDVPLHIVRHYRITHNINKSTELKSSFLIRLDPKIRDRAWLESEYITKNKSISLISKENNISKWSVSFQIKKMGLKKSTQQKNALAFASNIKNGNINYIFGLSTKDIMNKYKLSSSFVCSILNQYQFKSLEHLDQVFSVLEEGRKSNLEIKTSELLNIPFFNLKIHTNLNYRPDFKISEKVYLNVDGLYWHSEFKLNHNYHLIMRQDYEKCGFRLLQFREDEINNKSDIVKSMINNLLGKSIGIYARNTEIKMVTQKEATSFLIQSHLMGSITAKHIGLYHNNILVSLLSYRKIKNIIKIDRFCNKLNTSVMGGFSKLLKYLEKLINHKKIHYWVDLRYGTGNHLLNKGFTLSHETLGWKWTDGNKTYNRLHCRANMDDRKLSEKQHAEELNLYRIYDAGQRLYVKEFLNV